PARPYPSAKGARTRCKEAQGPDSTGRRFKDRRYRDCISSDTQGTVRRSPHANEPHSPFSTSTPGKPCSKESDGRDLQRHPICRSRRTYLLRCELSRLGPARGELCRQNSQRRETR